MLIFTNRGQSVTLETLKLAIERITKKDLSENMFRAVLSVNPDDYSLTMLKKTIHVKMENKNGKVSPSITKNRLECLKENLEKIKVENSNYIDLIMFPEAPKHTYMSAKQILEENIESISSDEFDMDDNRDTEEQPNFHTSEILFEKNPKKNKEGNTN